MKRDYSMTRQTRSGRPRRPIEIAMTPMIDVIFLLLVFFLATSSFQQVESLLPSGVSHAAEPSGSAAMDAQPDPTDDALDQIVIKLAVLEPGVSISLNGNPLTGFEQLPARLSQISSIKSDVPVIIDPDGSVKAKDAIHAYDLARQAGFSRVYMATRSPK